MAVFVWLILVKPCSCLENIQKDLDPSMVKDAVVVRIVSKVLKCYGFNRQLLPQSTTKWTIFPQAPTSGL